MLRYRRIGQRVPIIRSIGALSCRTARIRKKTTSLSRQTSTRQLFKRESERQVFTTPFSYYLARASPVSLLVVREIARVLELHVLDPVLEGSDRVLGHRSFGCVLGLGLVVAVIVDKLITSAETVYDRSLGCAVTHYSHSLDRFNRHNVHFDIRHALIDSQTSKPTNALVTRRT